jgi:hypothetical protein
VAKSLFCAHEIETKQRWSQTPTKKSVGNSCAKLA